MMIHLLTAIELTPGGSSTVHIYTQTINRTRQLTSLFGRRSMRTDRQAGRQAERHRIKKLMFAFRNYSKAPKNEQLYV